jgi:hypothetical protein
MRRYIAAIDNALDLHPDKSTFYLRWRKESGMSSQRP